MIESWKVFISTFSDSGILVIMAFILIAIMLWKLCGIDIPTWNGFLDSLNRKGGHILMGLVLVFVGITMMKIMLYDDGKYIVGAGIGILSRSMGTELPKPVDPATQTTETTTLTTRVTDKPKEGEIKP